MKKKLAVRDWHWEITNDCNLKCLHCILGDCSSQKLTTQESFKVISRIVQLGGKNLRITGGEPFMRKDLGLIVKEASASGLSVSLITNGTMLDNDFLKKYKKNINHMAVSIDGQKPAHEYLRGNGTYDRTILSVKKIVNAGIDFSVYVTMHSQNQKSLRPIMEELISMGVKNFHLNEINIEGRALSNKHLLMKQEKASKKLRRILTQLREIIEPGNISHDSSCSISPDSVYLSSNGLIYACVEIAFQFPEYIIAHIFDQEIDIKMNDFFSGVNIPRDCACRYVSFNMQGVSILLNRAKHCPIIEERRFDNE